MDIGLVLQADPPATDLVERAQSAEDGGFSHVWTFDSCVLWQEPFVIYPRLLAATSHIQVGPMVTNPATRDWSVTASLFATLNDMFGNRTVCGIGRGDSALRVIGRQPTSMQNFAEAITTIKEAIRTRRQGVQEPRKLLCWTSKPGAPSCYTGFVRGTSPREVRIAFAHSPICPPFEQTSSRM